MKFDTDKVFKIVSNLLSTLLSLRRREVLSR